MKSKAMVSKLSVKKMLGTVIVVVLCLVAPLVSLCQAIPPAPNAAGGPDVPFDDNMNLVFLSAGIMFAVYITVKQLRKKATRTA